MRKATTKKWRPRSRVAWSPVVDSVLGGEVEEEGMKQRRSGRIRRRARRGRQHYFRRKFLCSQCELRFYDVLQEAAGEGFVVMMKVRAAALLGCARSEWETLGRRVSQKEFDFVLVCRGSSYAACAIELDDRSHELPERKKRDKFLDAACKRAGLPLVRFPARRSYSVRAVREQLEAALGYRFIRNQGGIDDQEEESKTGKLRRAGGGNGATSKPAA
jgi:hypothetical protein